MPDRVTDWLAGCLIITPVHLGLTFSGVTSKYSRITNIVIHKWYIHKSFPTPSPLLAGWLSASCACLLTKIIIHPGSSYLSLYLDWLASWLLRQCDCSCCCCLALIECLTNSFAVKWTTKSVDQVVEQQLSERFRDFYKAVSAGILWFECSVQWESFKGQNNCEA